MKLREARINLVKQRHFSEQRVTASSPISPCQQPPLFIPDYDSPWPAEFLGEQTPLVRCQTCTPRQTTLSSGRWDEGVKYFQSRLSLKRISDARTKLPDSSESKVFQGQKICAYPVMQTDRFRAAEGWKFRDRGGVNFTGKGKDGRTMSQRRQRYVWVSWS